MDYGNGKWPANDPNGLYQFHPTISRPLVCAELTQVLSNASPHCFQRITSPPPPSICGDGIVQSPEVCDDGANNGTPRSCCRANCKKKPAARCLSMNSECCNACIPRLSRIGCNAGQGYCGPNGTCVQSLCYQHGYSLCSQKKQELCQQRCLINGQCVSIPEVSSNVLDGSVCKRDPQLMFCRNGQCTLP